MEAAEAVEAPLVEKRVAVEAVVDACDGVGDDGRALCRPFFFFVGAGCQPSLVLSWSCSSW